MFVPVIYGSVRSQRIGLRAVRLMARAIGNRGHQAQIVDPAELDLPMLDKRIFDFKEGDVPEKLLRLSGIFRRADAFVFVTAEYNHCIPPALKNLMDHFSPDEFGGRPSGIVSYSVSRFGGVRAAEQMRLLIPSFGAVTIPSVLSIPDIENSIGDNGETPDDSPWSDLAADFLAELEAWARSAPGATSHDGID
ncbi:MAG: NADPH-dependent FMN reductase [Parvibaculaceae bacterium]|uniref:NADPH-dependent FMN reductase n=1 Tax=Parvibaculum sp. TaxID=2024848 RepID=UPI0032EE05E3